VDYYCPVACVINMKIDEIVFKLNFYVISFDYSSNLVRRSFGSLADMFINSLVSTNCIFSSMCARRECGGSWLFSSRIS
jgi:hypothetical protein